jgi:hypothetical protein
MFKPHQPVRVKYFRINGEPSHWTPTMMSLRRQTVTISKIYIEKYHIIEMPQYVWYESDFEKVNTNAVR